MCIRDSRRARVAPVTASGRIIGHKPRKRVNPLTRPSRNVAHVMSSDCRAPCRPKRPSASPPGLGR
eukprot:2908144-Prymnesium_polylepis.1